MAYNDKGIAIGGTIIYEMPRVVHSQYISASPEGKGLGLSESSRLTIFLMMYMPIIRASLTLVKVQKREERFLTKRLFSKKKALEDEVYAMTVMSGKQILS